MASVIKYLSKASKPFHADRKRYGKPSVQALVAGTSCVLYVGNLSFYTTEDQVYALFSKCGLIERVIMGLNRVTKTPCGFCFVMYVPGGVVCRVLWLVPHAARCSFAHRQGAVNAAIFLNGTKLDDRVIRIEVDKGFREGRQYGRGASGGQVRDDLRRTFDPARGGFGPGAGNAPAAGGGLMRGPPPRGPPPPHMQMFSGGMRGPPPRGWGGPGGPPRGPRGMPPRGYGGGPRGGGRHMGPGYMHDRPRYRAQRSHGGGYHDHDRSHRRDRDRDGGRDRRRDFDRRGGRGGGDGDRYQRPRLGKRGRDVRVWCLCAWCVVGLVA